MSRRCVNWTPASRPPSRSGGGERTVEVREDVTFGHEIVPGVRPRASHLPPMASEDGLGATALDLGEIPADSHHVQSFRHVE